MYFLKGCFAVTLKMVGFLFTSFSIEMYQCRGIIIFLEKFVFTVLTLKPTADDSQESRETHSQLKNTHDAKRM